jgi:chitinase
MTTRALLVLCLLFLCSHDPAPAQAKDVIGYYPSWRWRSTKATPLPVQLQYNKVTIINYAFFAPRADGSIAGRDTVGDALILRGVPPAGSGIAPGLPLTTYAHRAGVRVVLSLGGWEDSGHFPAVARDASLRSRFARACLDAIATYDFDGIDIDWEFPGLTDHNGSPADREHFTLLLRVLRDSLDARGAVTGRHYTLSAALPSAFPTAEGMDIRAVAPLLDFLNVMTYDFHGSWDRLSGHNAPLYPGRDADSTRCVDAAFRLYRDHYGVPPEKINLGVPFYGRSFASCAGPGFPHIGEDTTHFSRDGIFYSDLAPLLSTFVRHRDDAAHVPYLTHPDWRLFVSYDDPPSIRDKARYVLREGARGLIIWELTGDWLPDGSTPLLDALHGEFSSVPSR